MRARCPKGFVEDSLRRTYDEVPGLIGAGEEPGWMSVHLVLEPGGRAVFCFATQSPPELICQEVKHIYIIIYIYIIMTFWQIFHRKHEKKTQNFF